MHGIEETQREETNFYPVSLGPVVARSARLPQPLNDRLLSTASGPISNRSCLESRERSRNRDVRRLTSAKSSTELAGTSIEYALKTRLTSAACTESLALRITRTSGPIQVMRTNCERQTS